MASSDNTESKASEDTKNLQADPVSSGFNLGLTELIQVQQQILEEHRQFQHCLQRHDVAIDNLVQLLNQLTETKNVIPSIAPPTTTSVTTLTASHSNSTSHADQSTKQLRSKQISQLFESTPFTGSPTQDVVDWLHEFNRQCDDILLDNAQRLSVARGLMTDDAKLWTETVRDSLVDWSSFQKRLVTYFQLAAGIDSFSFNEQLYTRQQQLHETAIHYYHDVMRLCSKVDFRMEDNIRLRHLYRGLRPESKVLISINLFRTPDEFLQELVRLEHLQKVTDSPEPNPSPFMIAQQDSSSAAMGHAPYPNHQSFSQETPRMHSSNRSPQGSQFHQSSSQYRHRRPPSDNRTNRNLNE
jgi:hypothetical protein